MHPKIEEEKNEGDGQQVFRRRLINVHDKRTFFDADINTYVAI